MTAQKALELEEARFWQLLNDRDINGLIDLGLKVTEQLSRITVVEIICEIPVE